MTNRLIALYSPAPSCGKSEITKALALHGYKTIKLAGTLKDMLRVFLNHYGLDPKEVERHLEGDLKEYSLPALTGITGRHLMQTLGTDWGRTCVAQDIWVRVAMGRITRELERGGRVVVDDMRFSNEYDAMFELGARLVKVTRPGRKPTNGHPSEGLLDGHRFDVLVENEGSLEALYLKTVQLME